MRPVEFEDLVTTIRVDSGVDATDTGLKRCVVCGNHAGGSSSRCGVCNFFFPKHELCEYDYDSTAPDGKVLYRCTPYVRAAHQYYEQKDSDNPSPFNWLNSIESSLSRKYYSGNPFLRLEARFWEGFLIVAGCLLVNAAIASVLWLVFIKDRA